MWMCRFMPHSCPDFTRVRRPKSFLNLNVDHKLASGKDLDFGVPFVILNILRNCFEQGQDINTSPFV